VKKEFKGVIAGPHLIFTAGVHGDEYEPVLAATRLSHYLEKNTLLKGKVTIVPIVNPTAYETSSRLGEDGLDLARICPGHIDGSSTEKEAAKVSALIAQADYLVDMHTGGVMYDIYPLAGYMLHQNEAILQQQRDMAMAFPLPVIWGTDATPDGRTLSVARDRNIPAIYLEYGGGTGIRSYVIDSYFKGCINLLSNLGMLNEISETLPLEERYWVEDPRTNSGYLQGMMPSPAEGIFEADVTIGQQVTAGQCWGAIHNPYTGQSQKVYAAIDGLVFLLRNLVKVKEGDALGGILPITAPGKVIFQQIS